MMGILAKYSGKSTPDAIIVLGQEAWNTYLSLNDSRLKRIPVFCGMVSRNIILTPSDSTTLVSWSPKSIDVDDFNDFNIKGGIIYEYSLEFK